jgi:glucosamine--fructose-6-phosphate aminotransferase (isomerizing)
MCGIIGYIGKKESADPLKVVIEGLKRLEYRGYDSAGVSFFNGGVALEVVKVKGKVRDLEELLAYQKHAPSQPLAIAHTRWATHGEPNEVNAHPHYDEKREIMAVHNGIVENYEELRDMLAQEGCTFTSSTDTEVIPHLVARAFKTETDPKKAVRTALGALKGSYAVAIISTRYPGKIIVGRKGSPLVIGISEQGYYVASDVSAVVNNAEKIIYLNDGEMAILDADRCEIISMEGGTPIARVPQNITWSLDQFQKGGFAHFMLKEIHEAPRVAHDACVGKIKDRQALIRELVPLENRLREIKRIVLVGCGTSYYAALVGKMLIEQCAHIPVEVAYASEFRYRPIVDPNDTLAVAISQSGETADTLEAIRHAKKAGVFTAALVNVVGSTMTRETDIPIYTNAGPEISVASTKAFVSQLVVLLLFALHIGRIKKTTSTETEEIILEELISDLPSKLEHILGQSEIIKNVAHHYTDADHFIYIGRGLGWPTALEGALKLKEISYIHAEGYPAGELKHGPLALISKHVPTMAIVPHDHTYEKMISNIEEIRSRSGNVIAIAIEGDSSIARHADHVLFIPASHELLVPILAIVPLQLFAYYIAIARGTDVDQPRNLAKSVTVE